VKHAKKPHGQKGESAGLEIRRGAYGAIGAGLVAAAGLVLFSLLDHKKTTTTTTTTGTPAGCVGCGTKSAAKVYG